MSLRRAVPVALGCLVLGGVTAGCVTVPTSGPVHSVAQAPTDQSEGVNIPVGPATGAPPTAIVSGFLDAMEAYPVSTAVAAEYLTDEAGQRWQPARGTVVYDQRTTTDAARGEVALEVNDVVTLSRRGTYRPKPGQGTGAHRLFSLTRVDGEWRITNPPNALYIRSYFFDSYYAPYDLYFLDPVRQALVADPVFLPTGDQLATQLVRGLLAGPTPWLGSQATTALPRSAQIEVSVPLRDDGVADVQLTKMAADLSDEQQQLLSAQLVWTLRQVPGVDGVRVSVGGTPLSVAGTDHVQAVDAWPQYDPSGPPSRSQLYALDDRGALTEVGQDGPVAGVWGRPGRGLTDFSIDRYLQLVAGVGRGATRLVEGPLTAEQPSLVTRRYVTEGRLSDPQWDRTGLLWVLEHDDRRTAWEVLGDEGGRAAVPAGRLGGARVTHMAVSPDGARVAALVPRWDGPVWGGGRIAGPCVVVARIVRRDDGQTVRRLDHAYGLRVRGLQVAQLRDVDWATPSDVVVLAGVEPLPPQPLQLAIDGSSVEGGPNSSEDLLSELGGVSLASAGVAGVPTVVGDRSGDLSAASTDGHWSVLASGLHHPHYPS